MRWANEINSVLAFVINTFNLTRISSLMRDVLSFKLNHPFDFLLKQLHAVADDLSLSWFGPE